MHLLKMIFAAALLLVAGCATTASGQSDKRIALTYDDAPLPDGPLLSGKERTEMLIHALAAAKVQAAFFVTTKNLASDDGEERIKAYAAAGHSLANHSHSHFWLRDVGPSAYLADIDVARGHLGRFANVRPWFRYPYLNESPDRESRDLVRRGLSKRGLRNGYVTVDTWDWALVDLVGQAKEQGRPIDMDALRDLYLEVELSAVETYDRIARDALGRSPAHVLLLHENDLAALFAPDLIAALRRRGWTIVSPDQAFADPIGKVEPDTLHTGRGRVAALAALRGGDPARLFDLYQDEELLERLFEERVIRR
ncbi:MAG TPA: polysaccharide deacetylase family protein [Sphingomicrobium sp.]|nr:polysaccharide deacetylase family protein [Sphingomicrobium sp.]